MQDAVGQRELADVVQQAGRVDEVLLGLARSRSPRPAPARSGRPRRRGAAVDAVAQRERLARASRARRAAARRAGSSALRAGRRDPPSAAARPSGTGRSAARRPRRAAPAGRGSCRRRRGSPRARPRRAGRAAAAGTARAPARDSGARRSMCLCSANSTKLSDRRDDEHAEHDQPERDALREVVVRVVHVADQRPHQQAADEREDGERREVVEPSPPRSPRRAPR